MNINEIIKSLAAIERASKAYAKDGKLAITAEFGKVRYIGKELHDATGSGDYHFVSDQGPVRIIPAQVTEIITTKVDGKSHFRIVLNSKPAVDGQVERQVAGADIPADQLRKGIREEREHLETLMNLVRKARVKTADQAKWDADIIKDVLEDIAQDHLKGIPDYYDRLAVMESKARQGHSEIGTEADAGVDLSAEIGCAVDYIEKQGRMQELIGEVSSPDKSKPCMAYIGSRVKARTKKTVSPADIAGYVMRTKVGQVSFGAEREEVGEPMKKPAIRTATVSDRMMVFAGSKENDGRMATPVQVDALTNLFPYLEYRPYLKKDLLEMPLAKAAYISAAVAENTGYDIHEFARAVFSIFGYKDEVVGMEVVDLGGGNLITREEVNDR